MEKEKVNKSFYEKPTVVKHSVGLMNKFGRANSAIPHGTVDGVPVGELIEQYGSPLFAVSEGSLRRKYREMLRAFNLRYPKVTIAYSYKTNYLSGVCAILHQEGAWAEVVSGFEYEIAMALGVPGNRIIFNGPHKKDDEILKAADNGSMINVDSFDEIYVIEELAKESKKVIEVGVRINMALGYPAWDRFGFNLETGQALDACKRILSSSSLKLVGLHIHLGTFITDVNLYRQMADKMVSFCYRLQDEPGVKLQYIDVGGGYASNNTLHSQWMPSEYNTPSFDQYAEAICPALLRGPFKAGEIPQLILEPGRAIVDEAVTLLASVVSTKRLSNGQKAVVIDAGINLLPCVVWYRYDIHASQETAGLSGGTITEDVNIYGPMCMQIDAIRMGVALPPLRRGDVLVVKNVGAYNFSQSLQFIQPRPAIVLVNNGETEYLRLPETTEYIRQLERVPERLTKK